MAKKAKTREYVLDGSVALAWYFKGEADPYANAVAGCFPLARAVVPTIWPLEVANAVLMGERRKRSTEAQAVQWLGYLASLPIAVDDAPSARVWSAVLPLARTHNLSAYDAAYLELALRGHWPLATLDDKLETAAKAIGVARFAP